MIESVNNERVKYWTKLASKKYQELEEKFLVEGEHLVEEAEKSGNLIEVIALVGTKFSCENITYVTETVMKKISSLTSSPRIIGVVRTLKARGIEGNVVLLDRIMDPGNLGTIIRSAVAFGIDTIVLGEGSVSIYNPKVVRATEGLLFHINMIQSPLEEVIPELKRNGYRIYTTDVEGGMPVSEVDFSPKTAVLVGNEGAGVDKGLSTLADEQLYIEMNPICESLNVGVATSIILYELNKNKCI